MLRIVIRKMLSNKWMVLCLLIGSVLTVAVLSSISIYSNAIMQRMLIKDLELSQSTSNEFPGAYNINLDYSDTFDVTQANRMNLYKYIASNADTKLAGAYQIPVIAKNQSLYSYFNIYSQSSEQKNPYVNMEALSDFKDHISITQGKLYSDKLTDNTYEVIISEDEAKKSDLLMGNTYPIQTYDSGKYFDTGLKIKIVGIFAYKDPTDAYWNRTQTSYTNSVLMDFKLMETSFLAQKSQKLIKAAWYFALDYHSLSARQLPYYHDTNAAQIKLVSPYKSYLKVEMPSMPIIEQYADREKTLTGTLWVLQVPIMIMLAFYTFMVSKLIIDFDSNEIAVLKSRGANSFNVFGIYFIESILISFAAIILGPPLGLLICTMLGSSNGFLEFVRRTALPVSLDSQAYMYSFFAVGFFILVMLIPAIIASRTSIVIYKQKSVRKSKHSLWEKLFLDVILLLLSIWGLYSYSRDQKLLIISGIKGTDTSIDPLLYFISALFILGAGLFLLRLFPYIVSFIYFIGRKLWTPVFYATFIRISRSGGQEQFLMLFLILTLSLGIYNANSARTINKNVEEKIRYEVGADIVVHERWQSNEIRATENPNVKLAPGSTLEELYYFEPPFERYAALPGVDSAARVFRSDKGKIASANFDKIAYPATLLGLDPNEFAKTNWFRNDLLPYHINQYLNLMVDNPSALLVSSSFQKNFNAKVGDTITVSWDDKGKSIEGMIYAFIDYWPSINPVKQKDGTTPYFVVANINYIQAETAIEPYSVWIKKKPGVTSTEIYKEMTNAGMDITSIKDSTEMLTAKKNDPLLQGTNGELTLALIVTMFISAIGFLIYWIMSIKKRVLQFGIFRAMGISMRSIIGMLILEQVLISGSAIFIGIFVGNLTSSICVPLLQAGQNPWDQVPPFRVVINIWDYIRLYSVIGAMLVSGFVTLGTMVSRINISQALKLGED